METLTAIARRRSVRRFTSAEVTPEQVDTLLRAAMAAPSAGNQQPWRFIVVRDRKILDAVPDFHPYCAMIKQVGVAVVVCGDTSVQKYPGYWVQDCSAAIQNLLLAATDLGLGAVWTGIHPDGPREEGCRKLFKLPPDVIPLAVIPVGVPEKEPAAVDRYIPDFVFADTWGKPLPGLK